MAFLTINGLDASSLVATSPVPKETERDIGEITEAFDGTKRASRQTTKHDIAFESPLMLAADAFAWKELLKGKGEHWSFDSSLYGSKGLGPNATPTATQATAGSSKFGAGYLLFTGSQTITYATGLPTNWTVMLWRSTDAGATWSHYVVDSSARKWVNGSRNDGASTPFISVASGSLTMADTTTRIDDLVVFPFLLLTTWPPVFGVATSAFSDLRALTIAGNAVQEATTRSVFGDCSLEIGKGWIGGALQIDARRLTVTLIEV